MKNSYKEAELEVIEFEIEDIVTASNGENPDDWGHDHDVVDDE